MDVNNKRIAVVGMGKTSLAVVRLLLREGALPFVTDLQNTVALQPYREQLEELGVPYECGGHTSTAFGECVAVVPSPGVPPDIEPIRQVVTGGARLLSELDLAFAHCRSKILAVTGTNGKTTTTELIRSMLEACGHTVALAGNNAHPFSEAVLADPQPEYAVLEASSYQLEIIDTFHPWIGVALNVTEDHLARHGTMDRYAKAKANLFAYQTPGECAVVNADDDRCLQLAAGRGEGLYSFSLERPVDRGLWLDGDTFREGADAVASVADVALPGKHNLQNVAAALTAVRAGGFDWEGVSAGLREFDGVEHRLERVATVGGTDYVNDSKSTNLDSLRVALESFRKPVVLIAGGRGKGSDYSALSDLVRQRVSMLITLGEDAPALEAAYGAVVPTVRAGDLMDAVTRAAHAAQPGETVLLSPGCASFDMYTDFEARGKAFKQAVFALRAQAVRHENAGV